MKSFTVIPQFFKGLFRKIFRWDKKCSEIKSIFPTRAKLRIEFIADTFPSIMPVCRRLDIERKIWCAAGLDAKSA